MATFDNSDARSLAAGSPTVSFSYTTTASANRVLLAASHNNGGGATVTAVTYNTVGLTNVGTTTGMILWRLTAPSSGANTLSFSVSLYDGVLVAASTWSSVDQTTPLGTVVTNSGNSATSSTGSITCPASGAIFGAQFSNYTSAPAPTINSGTLRGSARNAGSGWTIAGASDSVTGTLAWNLASSNNWEAIGVPINDVAGGGGASSYPPFRSFPLSILQH